MRTSVEADLCFRVEDADGQRIDGHLTGSGQVLTLRIDDPGAFAGAGDATAVRYVADELAARRLEVRVTDGRSTLVRLGDVRAPWWQRRLTRSRHLRIGSLRGLWTAAQARARRFSIEHMAAGTAALYRQLTTAGAARTRGAAA